MEHRRPSRRLIVAAAVTFSVMAAAVAWTWPWLQGWHHPPISARADAAAAVKLTVIGDGVLPAEIALVRQHVDRSFAEDRRQQAAFAWRRDFRKTNSMYRLTAATAASEKPLLIGVRVGPTILSSEGFNIFYLPTSFN